MMNKPDVGVLVAEYRQGHTLEAIASRHGLAPGTVRNHLLAAGEQLRPPGRRPGAAAPVGSGRDARARGNRPPPTIVGMAIQRIVDEGDVLTQRILEGLPSPVDDETLGLVRAKCLAAVVSVAAARSGRDGARPPGAHRPAPRGAGAGPGRDHQRQGARVGEVLPVTG
jgi:hypothetical protein